MICVTYLYRVYAHLETDVPTDADDVENRLIRSYRDFVIYTDYVEHEPHEPSDALGQPSAFALRVFDSPVGEGEINERVPVAWERLLDCRTKLATRDLSSAKLREYGKSLGELMLPPYARGLFERSLARLHDDQGLRIRLHLIPELETLPWEYALVQITGGESTACDFLALEARGRISIVRHIMIAQPAEAFRSGAKRRVVVAMASPKEYPRLKLEDEQKNIRQALTAMKGIEVTYCPDFEQPAHIASATEAELVAALNEPVDVFHFTGHGDFEKIPGPVLNMVEGRGAIVLSDASGEAALVTDEKLSFLLSHGQVRLAVLGACKSAESDVFHKWSGVARSLLKNGIPAVIAMQFSIRDDLATRFVRSLYLSLVNGDEIDYALWQGRAAMWLAETDVRDWGAPVLYLRNSGGRILAPVTDEEARHEAERSVANTATLTSALLNWVKRGAPADPNQLDFLRDAGDQFPLEPRDILLLLRSALLHEKETAPWVSRLRAVGSGLLADLDAPGAEAGPLGDAEKLLGLDHPQLGLRPTDVGAVAWSAARHPEPLTRRTAALALLALGEREAVERVRKAVRSLDDSPTRQQRRAELFGTLCEVNPATARAVQTEMDDPGTRLAVWWWRVRRHWRADRTDILWWTLKGALGSALALALYRGLLAIPKNSHFFLRDFAIYSYWGFILGAGLTFGCLIGATLLLQEPLHPDPARRRQVARLGVLLATLGFALANFLVAALNSDCLACMVRRAPAALIVGLGLALGLFDQPRAGTRLGVFGWGKRLLAACLITAAAQLPVLCQAMLLSGPPSEWQASAMIQSSEEFRNGFSVYFGPDENNLFYRCNPDTSPPRCCYACAAGSTRGSFLATAILDCSSQVLSILDAVVFGLLITAGVTMGLHWSRWPFKPR